MRVMQLIALEVLGFVEGNRSLCGQGVSACQPASSLARLLAYVLVGGEAP